jgi:hypothetical protein
MEVSVELLSLSFFFVIVILYTCLNNNHIASFLFQLTFYPYRVIVSLGCRVHLFTEGMGN